MTKIPVGGYSSPSSQSYYMWCLAVVLIVFTTVNLQLSSLCHSTAAMCLTLCAPHVARA